MTHTYKVGDKGKTRGGDDYEVTAVGLRSILATTGENHSVEAMYDINGRLFGDSMSSNCDLTPPERRIQWWVNWMQHETGLVCLDGPYDTQQEAAKGARIYKEGRPGFQRIACHYIDIEEGKGLNDEN